MLGDHWYERVELGLGGLERKTVAAAGTSARKGGVHQNLRRSRARRRGGEKALSSEQNHQIESAPNAEEGDAEFGTSAHSRSRRCFV